MRSSSVGLDVKEASCVEGVLSLCSMSILCGKVRCIVRAFLHCLVCRDALCIVGGEGNQVCSPGSLSVMPLQDRTALADTPGSRLASDCENLLAEGRLGELLNRLVEHIGLIFNKLDGKDMECCADILAHLASRAAPEELPEAVKTLVQALTTQACPSNA